MLNLWEIIRDFFVRFVFGGLDSTNEFYRGWIGATAYQTGDGGLILDTLHNSSYYVSIGEGYDAGNEYFSTLYISVGDWLSTTATIITLVGLFIAIVFLLIKLFRFVSNLFLLR